MTKLSHRLKDREWKMKMGDIIELIELEELNTEMHELLVYLRTRNMFQGNSIRTGFDKTVHPISDELAERMDNLILRGCK